MNGLPITSVSFIISSGRFRSPSSSLPFGGKLRGGRNEGRGIRAREMVMLAIHGVLPSDPFEAAVRMTKFEVFPLYPFDAYLKMTVDEVLHWVPYEAAFRMT